MKRKDTKIIRVTPEVHKQLLELGKKGETFNDIIERLIGFYNTNKIITRK